MDFIAPPRLRFDPTGVSSALALAFLPLRPRDSVSEAGVPRFEVSAFSSLFVARLSFLSLDLRFEPEKKSPTTTYYCDTSHKNSNSTCMAHYIAILHLSPTREDAK